MDFPSASVRELPAWPVYVLFAGFPVWWALGLGEFAVALVAIPMFLLLAARRDVEVPRVSFFWFGFVIWASAAALELSSGPRLLGFAVRLANYVGTSIVFIYLYNGRSRLSNRTVLRALVLFFVAVVAGGYLGLLVPHGSLSTPVEALLPTDIRNNELVRSLVHPSFAEIQHPFGSPHTFYRPSAPFPYANSWGCNVALLVPLVLAGMLTFPRRASRLVIAGLLVSACVPAAATLNRGMFLALAMMLGYASARLAFRDRLIPLLAVVSASTAGAAAAVSLGVVAKLHERLHYSQTNLGRETIYREAFHGALASPVFGHGAPRPSTTVGVSIGTQGQVWNVMFSYGLIALALFLTWFAVVVILTWRARTDADLWVHASLVVGLATFFYYGYDGIQLAVVMSAAAVSLRPGFAGSVAEAAAPWEPRVVSPQLPA